MKKSVVFMVALIPSLLTFDSEAVESKQKSMEELSKEMANPLAQVWNLSFQHNRSIITGDSVAGNEHINTTLFQPVLPIPLGDKYMFFARPVITLINGPSSGTITGGTPAQPIGHGTDRTIELGDIILPVGVGVVRKEGWSWGAGGTFIFPTSQNDLLGSHQYQAGPTALALWGNEMWTIGTHAQHWWGFADDNSGHAPAENHNHTDIQYFLVRQLPKAWQLRASPHVTIDWNQDSDNALTLPIGIGVGKMIKLGPMPVMLMAEYQYSVISPDEIGTEQTLMIQANFIVKNPFGSL